MADKLSIVTFKWQTPGYRATFTADHVNTLASMVKRHCRLPHRIVCVTDDTSGLDRSIESVPLWDDHASVPNPTGGGRPSCYRRLKLFDPGIGLVVGERFVMLDLDCVITSDVTPLWDRPEDAVFWKSPTNEWPYNGAMFMMTAGARPQVWQDFDPVKSPLATHRAGYRGSDQAWISHKLGWNEAVWTANDGVCFYGSIPHARRNAKPHGARIVFTTAGNPPWELPHTWIRGAYQ